MWRIYTDFAKYGHIFTYNNMHPHQSLIHDDAFIDGVYMYNMSYNIHVHSRVYTKSKSGDYISYYAVLRLISLYIIHINCNGSSVKIDTILYIIILYIYSVWNNK